MIITREVHPYHQVKIPTMTKIFIKTTEKPQLDLSSQDLEAPPAWKYTPGEDDVYQVPGGARWWWNEDYLKHHDGDDHQHQHQQNTLNDATMKQIMTERKKRSTISFIVLTMVDFSYFCFVHDDDDTEDELMSYVCKSGRIVHRASNQRRASIKQATLDTGLTFALCSKSHTKTEEQANL